MLQGRQCAHLRRRQARWTLRAKIECLTFAIRRMRSNCSRVRSCFQARQIIFTAKRWTVGVIREIAAVTKSSLGTCPRFASIQCREGGLEFGRELHNVVSDKRD